jgi:hypothetical protein
MDAHMPSVFIGSSSEGLDVAREVELQLQRDSITTIWKDGVFGLGSNTLESLMKVLEQFDFAVMVLSPDDLIESRSQSYASPRDNVILNWAFSWAGWDAVGSSSSMNKTQISNFRLTLPESRCHRIANAIIFRLLSRQHARRS